MEHPPHAGTLPVPSGAGSFSRLETMRLSLLNGRVSMLGGDCIDVMRTLPDASVDSIVTDPPYHLTSIVKRFGASGATPAQFGTDGAFSRASAGFMGKQWDGGDIAFRPETWAEVLRVLKPGGHMLAFGAPRNFHRLACAIEDGGFEIRDTIMWIFGSGFPKSHDVSKGIDRMLGAEREIIGRHIQSKGQRKLANTLRGSADSSLAWQYDITTPATDAARQWGGWGSALKPAYEPICLARKPLDGTIAANVLKHGVGALNIDASRVATNGEQPKGSGRWPANIIHDGSDEVVSAFPETTSGAGNKTPEGKTHGIFDGRSSIRSDCGKNWTGDTGSAARFFYIAKADADDRLGSKHPTVKPLDLMQYLVRLVTPCGGVVLDPFAGSGTTGEAAWREGCQAILIEREEEYQADIMRRMELALAGPDERARESIKERLKGKPVDAGPLFGSQT